LLAFTAFFEMQSQPGGVFFQPVRIQVFDRPANGQVQTPAIGY
jgi:hypothetical protein